MSVNYGSKYHKKLRNVYHGQKDKLSRKMMMEDQFKPAPTGQIKPNNQRTFSRIEDVPRSGGGGGNSTSEGRMADKVAKIASGNEAYGVFRKAKRKLDYYAREIKKREVLIREGRQPQIATFNRYPVLKQFYLDNAPVKNQNLINQFNM